MLNDKNNNISIYISDANYACLPRNYSPKKQLKNIIIENIYIFIKVCIQVLFKDFDICEFEKQ